MLTQECLRTCLHYDPETGVFRNLIDRGSAKAGAISGYKNSYGYIKIYIKGKDYSAHRLAWLYITGAFPTKDIDHKNLNPSDNRFSNLRLADESHNSANSTVRKTNKLGIKGVYKCGNRFRAQITAGYKVHYLGLFKTADAAHAAYLSAAKQFHGEFARGI